MSFLRREVSWLYFHHDKVGPGKVMAALQFQNDSEVGRESAKGYEGTGRLVPNSDVQQRRKTYGFGAIGLGLG